MQFSKLPFLLLSSFMFMSGAYGQSVPNAPAAKESAPNPIAATYPDGVTGTINGTIFVIPIPFELARSIIPKQWGINKKAYLEFLPGWRDDQYPLVIRSGVDHDVGLLSLNFTINDFQAVHTFFPFVDLLNDGYSSFNYNKYLLLTATALLAIGGSGLDGTTPVPASFRPDLEAYGYSPQHGDAQHQERYFNAYTAFEPPKVPTVEIAFSDIGGVKPWPMSFYVNMTNQPIFTNGNLCDNQIFLYNTTLSTGENAPRGVKGSIKLSAPLLPEDSTFENVFGFRVDTAFLETNGVPCANLKGYSGTGPGDRGVAGGK